MAEQDTTPIEGAASSNINELTQKIIESQEKLVEGQRHAGYQVWNKDGIATARIAQQSADIVGAIKGIAPTLIKEDDKDDTEDDTEAELERKKREENEREKSRGGMFSGMLGGIGGLLKSLAVGKDGKGEKSLFGKGGIWGIAKSIFGIIFKFVKFLGGPLLLLGGLALFMMDEKDQQKAIENITNWVKGVFEYIKFLGEAFGSGFMSGMDDVKDLEAEIYISWERVNDNAKVYDQKINSEVKRVIIHGCLHLVGYHDSTEKEKKYMRKKEQEYMDSINKDIIL